MKKWIGILLFLLCMTGLCACSQEAAVDGEIIKIYYVGNKETNNEVRDYVLTSTQTEDQVQEVLDALAVVPEKLEYKAPLSMGFELRSHRLKNGILTLDMDTKYKDMVPTTEVLVRYALVCSLTQLEEVNYVEITIEGSSFYDSQGSLVGAMNAEHFINNMGSEIGTYETAELVLYFTNEIGDQLIAINRTKPYNTNISLDRLVVEQVLAGPSTTVEGIYPTIDPNTKVVSVLTKDGVCYVNLDNGFLNPVYNVTADVAIYSLVNSLTELSNVNKVQISINGETSGMFREKYSFTTVFERNLDIVTTLAK